MCHCNSPYCEISSDDEVFTWASNLHEQLMRDSAWIERYPKNEVREVAISLEVWRRLKIQFPDRSLPDQEQASRLFRENYMRVHAGH